ncbi:1-acyl-sn-glycerol-3-phosphate acyltransferase [Candidatus Woesearchaeota archaeon]|nr:1-acyl-sn-glycerol-3-phosphate acyltransferase [Candidatus Woesearchaeota archaeon]
MGLEKIAAKSFVFAFADLLGPAYRIENEGLDKVVKGEPAVFVIKHQHMMDFLVGAYGFRRILKNKATVPVKESLFRNGFVAEVLNELGAVSMKRPQDGGYNEHTRIRWARQFIELMKSNGWYAYCPEATRTPGAVGDFSEEYIHPVLIGAKHGANIYVAGIESTPENRSPWIPFLTKKKIRCEHYDAKGKAIAQVMSEIKQKMAELSGLEKKLY